MTETDVQPSSVICVSIGRGRHKQVIAEHRHLAEQGARLVELRLDYIRRNVTLKRLLNDRPSPVIITCRREQDGGKWSGSEEDRVILLRAAIVEGVDYIDLEEDIADQVPRYGVTKRIISLHDFEETPTNLEAIHQRLVDKDADIVKIACLANCPGDVTRMLHLVKSSDIPTVGICMGDVGTPSRLLAGKFGAPFTYGTFHQERQLAPGQLSFEQMTDTFRYEGIDAETEVFGVIADPVGHSMSPIIHNAAFASMGMNRVYIPLRIPPDHLEQFIRDAPALGIRGLSVTIPHKESVMAMLTKIETGARKIGAVNTIVFDGDEVIGYNTDLYGAMINLADAAGVDPDAKWLENKRVLLLGAGGVARAIGMGVVDRGAELHISSRTHERALELAYELKCEAVPWDNRHQVTPDVLINGTPVGMHPNVNETPYEASGLTRKTIVFDTIYNPEQTLLIKLARQNGCVTVSGVDMFVRQAELQFKFFTGQEAPIDVMKESLRKSIGAAKGG
ncbi:MAG: shikimate dehydrogenase [Planctomycetota bacterium]|nr:shikimate dehydrogenase [Planctomycetota bacterium]